MSTVEKIRTVCPHCTQKMRIKTKYLGKTIPCPTCKTPFAVEALPEEDAGAESNDALQNVTMATTRETAPASEPPSATDDDNLFESPATGDGFDDAPPAFADDPLDELPPVHDDVDDALDDAPPPPLVADDYDDQPAEDYPSGSATDDEVMTAENAAAADDEFADDPLDEPADEPLDEFDGSEDNVDEEEVTEAPEPARHEERMMRSEMGISQPPSPPARRFASADADAPAPAPRAARPKAVSRIQPSKHFAAVDTSTEAAIQEFDFGRSGLFVPERSRVLVTDQSVYVCRHRRYLLGLMPGADIWITKYPIDAAELQTARVYLPSIGRMLIVFVLALAIGGAIVAAMHFKPEMLGFSADAAAQSAVTIDTIAASDLSETEQQMFGWLHREAVKFDIENFATWWGTLIPFAVAFVWYGWRFKAWFETGAFRLPIGRGKKRVGAVNDCIRVILEQRLAHRDSHPV